MSATKSQLVYDNVKFLAKLKHMKLKDVERWVGLPSTSLSKPMGKKGISIDYVCKFAAVLGVPVTHLFERNLEKGKEV